MATPLIIPTHKHKARFITCLIWCAVCSFFSFVGLYVMLFLHFKAQYLLVEAVVLFGVFYYGSFLLSYINGPKMFVHITAHGDHITFRCQSETGQTIAQDQTVPMQGVAGIYVLVQRIKLMKDYFIVFTDHNAVPLREISMYSDIYDCTAEDAGNVVNYIAQHFPVRMGTLEN